MTQCFSAKPPVRTFYTLQVFVFDLLPYKNHVFSSGLVRKSMTKWYVNGLLVRCMCL
ncbi:hypothetical protein HanRHA438_Chr11g0519591 [Helianthus annuus]|nr:hypothetical protein HanRHA438_Chr11g0519591 [Helianthus annuus]